MFFVISYTIYMEISKSIVKPVYFPCILYTNYLQFRREDWLFRPTRGLINHTKQKHLKHFPHHDVK